LQANQAAAVKFRLLGEQPLRAKGFQYDRNAMTWTPEDAQATTDSPAAPAHEPVKTPGGEFLHL
jgi:hypothetical protein